jgi:hypothetical protein
VLHSLHQELLLRSIFEMDGQIFLLVFLIVCGAIVCVNWLLIRDRPTDRSAIDNFAEQRGLRIISVTRSYNFFRYWFRGISVDDAVRFYELTVEDSEGNRGDIHVAFDSLFGPGRLVVLEQRGLSLIPPDGSVNFTGLDSETTRVSWSWNERLVLFVVGAGTSGFIFCGILHGYLSPPKRPLFPEPALGYTHFFKAKHGNVYGTFFEYLAVTYGIWISLGGVAVSGAFVSFLKIKQKSRTYPRQIFAAAAISMALCYAIWRVSIDHAPL